MQVLFRAFFTRNSYKQARRRVRPGRFGLQYHPASAAEHIGVELISTRASTIAQFMRNARNERLQNAQQQKASAGSCWLPPRPQRMNHFWDDVLPISPPCSPANGAAEKDVDSYSDDIPDDGCPCVIPGACCCPYCGITTVIWQTSKIKTRMDPSLQG